MIKKGEGSGMIFVQFTANQKTKIMIEVEKHLKKNPCEKINYDFIKKLLIEEFDFNEKCKHLKIRYLKENVFISLEENFELSIEKIKNENLCLLINYKMKDYEINGVKIKSLKNFFSKQIYTLKELYKERFLLLDYFLFSQKKILSAEDKEFLKKFYSQNEYQNLIDLIENKQQNEISRKIEEDSFGNINNINFIRQNFLNFNFSEFQTNLSSVVFEQKEGENEEGTEKIDFAILYSEPLVRNCEEKNNGEMSIITHKPVDFMTECNTIVDILKHLNKEISLYLKCLREESFKKAINHKPKVLHLICHGGFDENSNFYLEFEAENAVLLPYSKEDVKRIINDNPKIKNIQLIFINACFSENIAQIFLDSGVDCVVSIQRETKIVDKISKDFSKHFYSALLGCETIKNSFNSAIESIKLHYKDQKTSYHSCCCSHLHKEDCLWSIKTRSLDYNQAHNEHTPIYPFCKCKNAYKNLHEHCKWSTLFLINYRQDKSPQYKQIDGQKFICCCSLELPHDETLKFKLRYRDNDESLGDKKIFCNFKKTGEVKIVNFDNYGNNIFFDQERILGFNLYIYQIFQYMVIDKKKVILLKGKTGAGKTSLAKKFTNYANERKSFDFIKYIDFYKKTSFFNFQSDIENALKQVKVQDRKNHIFAYKKILIILDNMDVFIKKDIKLLNRKIKEYIEKYNLYLIIISECEENEGNNFLSRFYENRKTITIEPVGKEIGAKIFLSNCKDHLGEYTSNYFNLMRNDSFNEIYENIEFYPRNIIKLANLIVDYEEITLENVLEEYEKLNSDNKIKFKKDLNKDKFVANNKFMHFLARLPKGLIFELDIYDFKYFEGTTETENFLKFISKEVNRNSWKLKKYDSEKIINDSDDLEDLTLERRFSSTNVKNIKKNIEELVLSITQMLENNASNDYKEEEEEAEEYNLDLKYFTLTKSLKKMNFIIIRRNDNLKNLVELNSSKEETIYSMLNIIKFLNTSLTSILYSMKKKNSYYSKLTSFSALEDYGDWNIYNKSNEKVDALNNYEFLFYQIHHLNNVIFFIMNKELMEKLLINAEEFNDNEKSNDFYDLIEDFILKFLTVIRYQKNYQDKKNKLLQFYSHIFTWMNSISSVSENFIKLQMKIHIFIISFLYENYNDLSNTEVMQEIETEINTMDILITTNKRDEMNELILHKFEYILLKLIVKGSSVPYRTLGKNLQEMSSILITLKEKNYHNLVMRMLYIILNEEIKRREIRERTLREIDEYLNKGGDTQNDFIRFKLCILMHSVYEKNIKKSKIYLTLANNFAEIHNTEDFLYEMKELKDDHFKNTKSIKNKRILFLVSSPLVNGLLESRDFSIDFKPYFKLKTILHENLKNKKKKIFLDYDRLTENNLKKYIEETGGCKVCCLYFNHSTENNFFLETQDLEGKIWNDFEMIEFFKKMEGKIDLLILVNPYSKNKICKDLRRYVPYIIYFVPKYNLYPHSIWLKKMINKFVNDFLIIFFDLLMEKNILESFQTASEQVYIDLANYSKKKYILETYFKNKKIHTTKTKATEIIKEIFQNCVKMIKNEESKEPEDYFEMGDLSSNVKDLDLNKEIFDFSSYFVGRQNELHFLYRIIENNMTLIINGKEGIGKTFLIKEYLFRAYSLGIYENQIIIYSEEEYDQIVNSITNDLELNEKNNYTKSRKTEKIPKIVVVLDDFQSCYLKDLNKIKWDYFFSKLDLCLIIITTEPQLDLDSQTFKYQKSFTVGKFDERDSLNFILAILEEDKFIEPPPFDQDKFIFQKIIESCKGIPKSLSNQKYKDIKVFFNSLNPDRNHQNKKKKHQKKNKIKS